MPMAGTSPPPVKSTLEAGAQAISVEATRLILVAAVVGRTTKTASQGTPETEPLPSARVEVIGWAEAGKTSRLYITGVPLAVTVILAVEPSMQLLMVKR